MQIRVLFFGATASVTGERQIDIDLAEESNATEILHKLLTEYPDLAAHRLLFSINQQYASGDEIIQNGDELAIFTAVSGG